MSVQLHGAEMMVFGVFGLIQFAEQHSEVGVAAGIGRVDGNGFDITLLRQCPRSNVGRIQIGQVVEGRFVAFVPSDGQFEVFDGTLFVS